jgi:hypothetical protein
MRSVGQRELDGRPMANRLHRAKRRVAIAALCVSLLPLKRVYAAFPLPSIVRTRRAGVQLTPF